jgi:hypothetical protein
VCLGQSLRNLIVDALAYFGAHAPAFHAGDEWSQVACWDSVDPLILQAAVIDLGVNAVFP